MGGISPPPTVRNPGTCVHASCTCILHLYILQMYSTHTFTSTSFPTQNRELQIMRRLDHCNIIRLRYFFYSAGDKVHVHW